MDINTQNLHKKLILYRNQFHLSLDNLSQQTGISIKRLGGFENNDIEPTGDEILILSDFYKCDYMVFISNEKIEPIDETDSLYRKYEDEFNINDRWAIQELLYLAECENFLQTKLERNRYNAFQFTPTGTYYKKHAEQAAEKLRTELGYGDNDIPNVFDDFRKMGLHIFRRKLDNTRISGLYINHPSAGKCILINYLEDIYRQRFTLSHEVAHSIFDNERQINVSFTNEKWDVDKLIEIRADSFASNFLLPSSILKKFNINQISNSEYVINFANQLKVSIVALTTALLKNGQISDAEADILRSIRIPLDMKIDPELKGNLSSKEMVRKKFLLEKGLSTHYVLLCFNAYESGIISASKIAEMLLITEEELTEIAILFKKEFNYGLY